MKVATLQENMLRTKIMTDNIIMKYSSNDTFVLSALLNAVARPYPMKAEGLRETSIAEQKGKSQQVIIQSIILPQMLNMGKLIWFYFSYV